MVVGDIAMGTQLLVIGGGPGGYVAAIRGAQLGLEVTLVEKEELGGICLNHGCIPSKALIHAASLYRRIPELEDMGLRAKGVTIDPEKLQEWKGGVVRKLTSGVEQLCDHYSIQVIQGKAAFTGPKGVHVEGEDASQSVEFENCIIATGAEPVELPGIEFDGRVVLSSREALSLREVPDTLVVIGGGYIGLELGTAYAKLGSEVRVVEMMDQLLPGTDPELVKVVERRLTELGVVVHLNAKAKEVDKGEDGARLVLETPDGEKELEAERILQSVGRRPHTEGLQLEKANVEVGDGGFVKSDRDLKTTNSRVYAIGDVSGQPLLAHKASHEGMVAAGLIAGEPVGADWLTVPSVIFTDPEIATAGLSEAEAEERGFETSVGKFPFSASGRALSVNEGGGFVKVIADATSDVLLGVGIVGAEASTMVSEAALAIEMGARVEDLALTVHPHPTLPESLMGAAEAVHGRAIHIVSPKVQAAGAS